MTTKKGQGHDKHDDDHNGHQHGNGKGDFHGGRGDDRFYGGRGDDRISGGGGNDLLFGGGGNDTISGGDGRDALFGGSGADTLKGDAGDDLLVGGRDDDRIFGGSGNDVVFFNALTDGADTVDLGIGSDVVLIAADEPRQIRLTFTSSEVGNGSANDSKTLANQDGGLAVRLQAESGADCLVGPVSRFDDEGITFVSAAAGVTFDVRDLVSGVARGDQFEVVVLGTNGNDTLSALLPARAYYFNAGMGNDTVTGGNANDFLVGGAGNDNLSGGLGNDSFIGGGGNDTVSGAEGNDTAIFNVSTDGADRVDLGMGSDLVNVSAAAAGQVRLTFTSSEVGNGSANDSNTLANQDGGLAVRLQAENGADGLVGPVSRYDDEGITFVSATAGVTFDVRDLVSGVARGDQFEVVVLGTNGNDTLSALQPARPYYFNAGMGNDTVTGGNANDFLVGGAGNDSLSGGLGNDSFIGGGGNDTIAGADGDDRAIFNVSTDGSDQVNLGMGSDLVNVSAAAAGQVRLTFTSSEVGNGSANDSNTLANQDGGLAVRLQAENGADALTGPVSRYDDEGSTFVSATPGLTFDVRDLVSGVARGDQFEVVVLGTNGNDTLSALQTARAYYFNAGMGNDTVTGGNANDFLVGGAGNDSLSGGLGNDSFIGGGGNDTIAGADGDDRAIFNVSTDGSDSVNLGIGSDLVTVNAAAAGQIRLTFTSSEVGNGSAMDSNTLANQDGGLAVRLQAEGAGMLNIGYYDMVQGQGVSDQVASIRAAGHTAVQMNTLSDAELAGIDMLVVQNPDNNGYRAEYLSRLSAINTAVAEGLVVMIHDRHVHNAESILPGSAGFNIVRSLGANIDFINDAHPVASGPGGALNDVSLDGGNFSHHGFAVEGTVPAAADKILSTDNPSSLVTFSYAHGEGHVVYSSIPLDFYLQGASSPGVRANMRAYAANVIDYAADNLAEPGALVGPVSRFDDEGSTFVAGTAGVTFDVRDLVSGVARGDRFEVVVLGTNGNDTLSALQPARPYYFNAGMGNDTVTGGNANDFLVGGAGNDNLSGGAGNDTFISGGGNDSVSGGAGLDNLIFNAPLNAATNVDSVADFSHADDTLQLDDLVFTGLSPGPLAAGAFAMSTAAPEADDRIIYELSTGNLFFDANGGARSDMTLFATLTNKPADLAAVDFFII